MLNCQINCQSHFPYSTLPYEELDSEDCESCSLFASKLIYFLVLLQLAKRLCPFTLYRVSVQGCMVDSKSDCANAQTHRDETSRVTDLSPG